MYIIINVAHFHFTYENFVAYGSYGVHALKWKQTWTEICLDSSYNTLKMEQVLEVGNNVPKKCN